MAKLREQTLSKQRREDLMKTYFSYYPEYSFPRGDNSEETAEEMIRTHFRSEIEPQLDPEYIAYKIRGLNVARTDGKWFSEICVTGLEGLSPERQHVFYFNHQSHFDYYAIWKVLNQHWIDNFGMVKPTLLVAGKNLDLPITKLAGDFRKAGAFWVDRDLIANGNKVQRRLYGETLEEQTDEWVFKRGFDMVVFSEGGRDYDGKVMKKMKVRFLNALTEKERDVDVTAGAVGYDERYEEWAFPLLERFRTKKNIFERTGYLGADALAFFTAYLSGLGRQLFGYSPPDRRCYVNFGKPINISDVVDWDEERHRRTKALSDYVSKEIRKLHREIRARKREHKNGNGRRPGEDSNL